MSGLLDFFSQYSQVLLIVGIVILVFVVVEVIDKILKKAGKSKDSDEEISLDEVIVQEDDKFDDIKKRYEDKIAFLEKRVKTLEAQIDDLSKVEVEKVKTIDLASPKDDVIVENEKESSITSDLNLLVEEIKTIQPKNNSVTKTIDLQEVSKPVVEVVQEQVVEEIQLPDRLVQLKKMVISKVDKCKADLEDIKVNDRPESERQVVLEELVKAKAVFDEYKKLEQQYLEKNKK